MSSGNEATLIFTCAEASQVGQAANQAGAHALTEGSEERKP